MKINWSIKLGIGLFIVMVFGWIFLPSWLENAEWEQSLKLAGIIGVLVIVAGLCALYEHYIIKYNETEQHKQDVAEFVDNHKTIKLFEAAQAMREEIREQIHNEVYGTRITHKEMRDNAESFLTQDQKAHLYMVSKNPAYKIDTKV